MYTIPLEELSASSAPIVGGKAAMLGELMQLRTQLSSQPSVPNGVAITAQAFEDWFLGAGFTDEKLAKAIETCGRDVSRLESLSQIIHKKLLEAEMPAIETDLDADTKYAVRSSGIGEDGAALSFAGQHDSILDSDTQHVIDDVRRVWLSAFNPRALYYRALNNLLGSPIRQGVVIQEMVKPDFAGVVFSVDPRTGERDKGVLEYVVGLGDKLVSGEVTPARLVFDHPSSLTNKFGPVSVSAIELQGILGYPVDVEWALAKGVLYLLQVRPQTSIPVPLDAAMKKKIDYKHPTYGLPFAVAEPFSPGTALAAGFISREQANNIIKGGFNYGYAMSNRFLLVDFTTPDDLPIMEKVRGVVVQEGGITSHAAIVCRELGKPCVKITPEIMAFINHDPAPESYSQFDVFINGNTGAMYEREY